MRTVICAIMSIVCLGLTIAFASLGEAWSSGAFGLATGTWLANFIREMQK